MTKNPEVSNYIKEAPQIILDIRKLCLEVLSGYKEEMHYKMPCYVRSGEVEVAFANQKNYVSLYILKHDVMQKNASLLSAINHGRGCIRFKKSDILDVTLVTKLLNDTILSSAEPCT